MHPSESGKTTRYTFALYVILACFTLVFPSIAVTVPEAATASYAFLLLIAIPFGWQGWRELTKEEILVLLGFAGLFLVTALSLVNTENLETGVGRLGKYARFLAFIPIYMMYRKYCKSQDHALKYGVMAAGVILFLVAAYQSYSQGMSRVSGVVDIIQFGSYASVIASILVVLVFANIKNSVVSVVAVLCAVCAFCASMLAGSRGAWLALLINLLLVLLVMFSGSWRHRVVKIIVMLVIITAPLIIFNNPVQKRLNLLHQNIINYEKGKPDNSYGLRLIMWKNSWLMFKESPLLGTGIGDFQTDSKQLVDAGKTESHHVILYTQHAHSIYFHTLAISGALGLLTLLLACIIFPLVLFSKAFASAENQTDKFMALSGAAVVVAFAVFGVTESWLAKHSFISIYLIFIMFFMAFSSGRKGVISHV